MRTLGPGPVTALPDPFKGIAYMVGAGGFLTVSDAVVKWLTQGYPVGQILFMRGCFIFVTIGLLLWRFGGLRALRVRDLRGQFGRGILTVLATSFFVFSLKFLPLADAIVIGFVGPIFVTAMAPVFLGERVGWRRWSAVAVGFAGVLVMVRPAGDALRWAALLPAAGAFFGALRDIITRRISATESSVTTLAFTTACVTVAGLATWPFGWTALTPQDLGLFAVTGIVLGVAQFLVIEAFRLGEAALVAPFKYSTVVWATILGFLVWRDVPDAWVTSGAALVIGSGLFIWWRETGR
ncbi:MAG: DMT family transporter [Rhodospirillales bacterium]|nr:DMT family transporter [Rhodospirillales bacterium]